MKLFRIIFSIMMALMIYVIGGCSDEDVVERCKDNDMLPIGEYLLVNDVAYRCTSDDCYCNPQYQYSQCIFVDQRENTYGWTWTEIPDPESSGEITSAYLHYGEMNTLGSEGSTTPALPVPIVDTTSITIDYDACVSTTSEHRLRIIASNSTVYFITVWQTVDLVIYVDYSDPSLSSAAFQKRVMIDGEEYDYYKESSSGQYWTGITHSFVKVVTTQTGTLRLHKFLGFLRDDGYSGMGEIDYIRFSQSMRGGAGSTTIRNFSVEVK